MIKELTSRPTTVRTPDDLKAVLTEPWIIIDSEPYALSDRAAWFLIRAGNKRFIIALVDSDSGELFYYCPKAPRGNHLPGRDALKTLPYVSCQTGKKLRDEDVSRENGMRGPWVREEAEALDEYYKLKLRNANVLVPFSAEWFRAREDGQKRAESKRAAIRKMKAANRKQERQYWAAVNKLYLDEDSEIERSMRKSAG